MKTLLIIIAALVAAVIFLGARGCTEQGKTEHYKNAFAALNDSVRTFRNKQGQYVAAISVLTVDREALLAVNAGKDKQLAQLKAVVAADKNVKAATVFRAEARGRASGASVVTLQPLTPRLVSIADTSGRKCPPLPTYTSTVKGDGLTAHITAGPDSTTIDEYTVEQDYAVAYTSKKNGFLKPNTGTVEVTALSPNGRVTAVRSFEVPEQKPHRLAWFGGGAVVTAVLTALLLL
jgi:hypothetical protein